MAVSRTKQERPGAYVTEVKERIARAFPDAEFRVVRLKGKNFRLDIRTSADLLDIQDVLDGLTTDILVDHDVWIVLSVIPKNGAD